jgi:uncharacterized protein (DUF58 family)
VDGFLESCDALDSRQFFMAVKRLADSLNYGADRSPFLGSGVEYVQSRAYQWGDPIRIVDWKVTARTGKIHVKQYEAPKRLACVLLLDSSASMTISSQKRSKYATAVQIAGGLAFAALDRLSPVGLVTVGSRDLRVEPTLSKQRVMQWLEKLRRFRYDEGTTLERKTSELNSSLKSRAVVIILSDMHDPGALSSVKLLSQKHDVVVIRLRDPAEESLGGIGFIRAQEAESGRSFVTHGRSTWVDNSTLTAELKRAGIDQLDIDTDKTYAHRLRFFFASRDLLGKGAR